MVSSIRDCLILREEYKRGRQASVTLSTVKSLASLECPSAYQSEMLSLQTKMYATAFYPLEFYSRFCSIQD